MFVAAVVVSAAIGPSAANAVYDTPNNDGDCPGNCRQVPWQAGSDQWNSGALPTYSPVACTGLVEGNGTTDNAGSIQACLNSLSSNQAALIPPGIYYVNRQINIPSNRVLRGSGSANCTQGTWLSATFIGDTGAGATCTTLKLGSSGGINIGTTETRGSKITINSGYTKGSKSLTLASVSGLSVGTWVSIFETGDSAIPTTPRGDIGTCTWCGENNGSNLIQQFAQITAINGTTITISRPLYYAYAAGNSPGVKTLTFSVQRAGIEDIKLNGRFADHGAFITLEGALFSWVKNIETYDAGTGAKANHVNVNWSHGVRSATRTSISGATVAATAIMGSRSSSGTATIRSRTTSCGITDTASPSKAAVQAR